MDGAGRILAWRAIRGPGVRTSGTSSVASLEPVSLARDGRVPTTGAGVAWWSAGRFAASFDDGSVFVADAPSMRNALGDAAETFAGAPALAACPRRAISRHRSGSTRRGFGFRARRGFGFFRRRLGTRGCVGDARGGGSASWSFALARGDARRAISRGDGPRARGRGGVGCGASVGARARVDPDDVHKARWEASTPSREALTDSWAKISDRAWAAAKCAVAVAPTYEAQRVVLARGLRETEKHIRDDDADETDVDDESNRGDLRGTSPPSREWCWWTRLRLTLLAQLDRLDTLHAAHLGNYSPRAYASFRSADLGDAARSRSPPPEITSRRNASRGATLAPSRRVFWTCSRRSRRRRRPRTTPVYYRGRRRGRLGSATPAAARALLGARRATRYTRSSPNREAKGEPSPSSPRARASPPPPPPSPPRRPPRRGRARAAGWLYSVALVEACRVAAERGQGGAAGWARRVRAARCDEEAGAIGAAAELLAAAAAAFHDDASLGAAARAAAELASAVCDGPAESRAPLPGHPVSSDALVSAGEGRTVHPKTEPPSCHLVAVSSLWSASLAGYVDASASSRFAALMADAAPRPESVDAALDAAAVRRVLSSDGGGDAFASWLAAVVAADRPDVAAAAIRRAARAKARPGVPTRRGTRWAARRDSRRRRRRRWFGAPRETRRRRRRSRR